MSRTTPQSLRWPLSAAVGALAFGMLAGVWGARLLPHAAEQTRLLEALSETAVLVSLFCVGLRLGVPLEWKRWRAPVRLATVTMLVTIALVAGAANVFLDLPFTQALLLGAILAPTDPVLAGDVRLPVAEDEEAARFPLVAEGALSSSLALPVVLFALGLAGPYEAGPLRWLVVDVGWALAAGLALGWGTGWLAAQALERLDGNGQIGVAEILLVLSAMVLAYGSAEICRASGFLAVLSAGYALVHGGRLQRARAPRISRRLSSLADRVERVAELAMVALVGALLSISAVRPQLYVFALAVLIAIRPIAARLGLAGLPLPESARRAVVWFGIRSMASLYYLAYAINQGLSAPLASELTAITLAVLATSVVLHGLTALPLLKRPLRQEG
jgi:sodium/hydrogen antiporter